MAPLSRGGIPVPRDHQRAAGAGSGGRGRGVPGAGSGRRPSMRDGTQAPWRSSLDLVWSYSRSQAFYGENIATSPSFADRRWAGPSNAVDSSVEETSEDDEETTYDDDDDDDEEEETDEEEEERQGRLYGRDDDIVAQSPAGAMEWADEQLPPNAVVPRRSSRSGMLGRREWRRTGERSPGRRGEPARALDRNIRRIAADDSNDEERSRSRSRSPKRVGLSRPSSSSLRPTNDEQHSRTSPNRVVNSLRSNLIGTKQPQDRGREARFADENTPLLGNDHEATLGDVEGQGQKRPTTLQTPSWFRNSNMSVSSSKYRLQGYGSSTFWQSWFNTVNALVGVGILALPLAISYAGLILGISMFLLCGLATNYTGKVLAHIMAAEPSLRTYADIGNAAFGTRTRSFVALLFCLELWAVSTALIILFGDSLHALLGALSKEDHASGFIITLAHWSPAAFRALGVAIVLPTMFLSLRLLSPISVVGIVSVVTLFVVVLSDGLIKQHAPGSLRDPIPPSLGPQWSKLPLSFGLIMSGFSSHPIIPSLFKDMRNPKQFCRMLNWAYVAATIIYLAMGLIGYLMFGHSVSDEITRDVSQTRGYPRWLNYIAIWLIIINPLSKFALAARPIVTTVEILLGVEQSQVNATALKSPPRSPVIQKSYASLDEANHEGPSSAAVNGHATTSVQGGEAYDRDTDVVDVDGQIPSGGGGGASDESPLVGSMISIRAAQRTARWSRASKIGLRVAVQISITFFIGLTAVILPGFEKVMAFLGAFLACATCIFGPLLAKLILFRHELSRTRIMADCAILFTFFIVATLGTIWSFLPSKH